MNELWRLNSCAVILLANKVFEVLSQIDKLSDQKPQPCDRIPDWEILISDVDN
jgi:hypothetical protein